ncbi:protein stoned-B [Bradysia coprophila]|uniref:protein stoned-B n=1 Tax=Bradysia coprophila TaxID=38358 RepID=UPI00187DC783|nr:protein stoned-B [Bradysia coprophila]
MANPFLMTDDDVSSTTNDLNSNPFLMQDTEEGTDYAADNPFLAQANNPFAAFGDEEVVTTSTQDYHLDTYTDTNTFLNSDNNEMMITSSDVHSNPIDSAMSFFGTTITDMDDADDVAFAKPTGLAIQPSNVLMSNYDDTMAYSSEDELKDKRLPPPRPVPPSQTTQDLILSVADQLDQTSSHLLNRIPVTRTPSPVSMRDLHSPSPTPEFGDLLDVSELPHDLINQNDGFGDSQIDSTANDNPFMVQDELVMSEPSRPPPPARPTPPRPTPPRRPSPPQAETVTIQQSQPPRPAPIQQPQAEPDLFDMFGTGEQQKPPQPPAPKSNQDILSLFSTPKPLVPVSQPDLLSGDILSMDNEPDFGAKVPVMGSQVSSVSSLSSISSAPPTETSINTTQAAPVPQRPPAPPVPTPHQATVKPPQRPAPPALPKAPTQQPVVTPKVESTTDKEPNTTNVVTKQVTPQQEKENILDEVDTTEISMHHSPVDSTPVSEHVVSTTAQSDHSDEHMDTSGVTPIPSVNPFASPESEAMDIIVQPVTVPAPTPQSFTGSDSFGQSDEFDAFAAKFDSVKKEDNSLLDGFGVAVNTTSNGQAWGQNDNLIGGDDSADGFGNDEEGFDSFLAMKAPIQETPFDRNDSHDSDEGKEFNVVIRPKNADMSLGLTQPVLAPPPRSTNNSIYSGDSSPRFNPFDKGDEMPHSDGVPAAHEIPQLERTDSQETPPTPLFDEDVSQPLEDFPRITYQGEGWEMQLRQPNKKKITGQRFWKKIFLKIVFQGDNPVLQLLNAQKDKEPFQELPLQACYSVSEISAQQFDQFGKIFTVKLQYIFYKERPGVRPGQVTKAERITNKLSQFAAYAIQGDYQGVKEFGSDLKKLGLPVEHAPQVSQLFKIASHNYEDLKQFSVCIDELLFKYNVHRDRALTYKSEEVQLTAVDEIYVEQDAEGHILKQIARVRLFFLGFLSGMPTIELGVNDLWRQGKEVVGRHDIIPVVTEEWIRLEGVEFHSCVQQNEYERSRTIRFQPPDACYIELMRFRVRPPKNRELPFQLKAVWCVTGNKVELRADVLVPGFASRKLGQIPCEDVSIRFPIPECWIYLFRVEKHFRYGSVKSAHRRTGKIKGIERILGTVDQLQESLIEVTSGQAKYEHHHRAIVWRCPRLPKEGQGAYTTHQLVVRMALTSYDQIPEQLAPYCYVEFTMPATQVSHVTVRSVSVQDSDSDDPPEKYVRYLARHEYRVGIEHTTGQSTNAYLAATAVTKPKEEPPPPALQPIAGSDSDSDSN